MSCSRLIKDNELESVRARFFEGEIGHGRPTNERSTKKRPTVPVASPPFMLKRIHYRLRKVLDRACHSSTASRKIVDDLETWLVSCFSGRSTAGSAIFETWLEPPTVTKRSSRQTVVKFYFEPDSQHGGFHRLLLHGISQFHGLTATSTSAKLGDGRDVRLLTVLGIELVGPDIQLTKCVLMDDDAPGEQVQQIATDLERLKPFETQYTTVAT